MLVLAAWAYPVALLLLWYGLHWIGESWWVTAAGLYVPRIVFAAPLPLLSLLLWLIGPRRLLWTQVAAAIVVMGPLMGFVLPLPRSKPAAAPTLRVLSFNVDSGRSGTQAIADRIASYSPDIVLLQEYLWREDLVAALQMQYPQVQHSTQFVIASRYPITATVDPERLQFRGRVRSPRFMRYVVDTPLGRIAFYNLHPISPRGVLNIHELRGALHQLRTGQVFQSDEDVAMADNADLRALQVAAAASQASREQLPVIIAGDTNLPGLSRIFSDHLGSYADGFRVRGWGFGYTFPSKLPLMRLDRILASDALQIVSFHSGCKGVSDHHCVVADIQAKR